jgi:CheY-like chemotaxis protein
LIQHLSPKLPLIEGDSAQIRQLVLNLITNASEILDPRGGTITVTTSLHYVDSSTLALARIGTDLPQGTYVGLSVADTGAGMDEATKARIFDPFFSTKFTGRGLGMAAVLGIVRSHHSALLLASEPGCGSIFTIYFPSSQQIPLPDLAAPIDAPTSALDSIAQLPLVLVIDDEEAVRQTTTRILERGGYAALSAADGESGLALSRSLHQPIAAVLLDLTMPRVTGEQVFRDLRQDHPDLPILLMSGYAAEEMSARFTSETAARFIQKPFSAATLLAMVAKAIARTA